jgi:hypothetical protein
MERTNVVVARQWHSKRVSMATDTDATTKDVVFSMQSMLSLYNKDQLDKPVSWTLESAVSGQFLIVLLASIT